MPQAAYSTAVCHLSKSRRGNQRRVPIELTAAIEYLKNIRLSGVNIWDWQSVAVSAVKHDEHADDAIHRQPQQQALEVYDMKATNAVTHAAVPWRPLGSLSHSAQIVYASWPTYMPA